jgi:hypothetical protein
MNASDAAAEFHERTKHTWQRIRASSRGLDWATTPSRSRSIPTWSCCRCHASCLRAACPPPRCCPATSRRRCRRLTWPAWHAAVLLRRRDPDPARGPVPRGTLDRRPVPDRAVARGDGATPAARGRPRRGGSRGSMSAHSPSGTSLSTRAVMARDHAIPDPRERNDVLWCLRERLAMACLRAFGLGAPGPAAIPMAPAGARGERQEVRAQLLAGRHGRGRGANPGPCHGHGSLPNHLAPGRSQGEGNRSPRVLLVRQVHDCLGPSDVLVVRQVADALDAKGPLQGPRHRCWTGPAP